MGSLLNYLPSLSHAFILKHMHTATHKMPDAHINTHTHTHTHTHTRARTHTRVHTHTLQSADSAVPGSMVKVLWMAPQRAARSVPLMMCIPLETPLQHNEYLRGRE